MNKTISYWKPLFLVSFAALFFEVLIIRWCSSEIRSIMGTIAGACLEYSSLLIGSNGLVLLAAAVYAGSLLAGLRAKQAPIPLDGKPDRA